MQKAKSARDGKTYAETNLTWSTVDLVKAGWIEKNGTGLWKITEEGRNALVVFPNSRDLATEAHNRYNAWSALTAEKKKRAASQHHRAC